MVEHDRIKTLNKLLKQMKTAVPIILMVILAYSCSNTKEDKEATQYKIKNCKVYSADFGLLDETNPGLLMQEFAFNEEGYVRELIRYDNDGQISGQFEIKGKESPFPLPESPEFKDTTILNAEYGTLGDLRKKEIKKYNSHGLLIEVQLFNSQDSLKQKNTYEYNSEGFVCKDIYWDVELNTPIQIINYQYEFY